MGAAAYLAVGMSTLINLSNPEAIVIAGGFTARASDLLIKPLISKNHLTNFSFYKISFNILMDHC